MLSQDEHFPNTEPPADPNATAWHPSSDPDATEHHASSGASGAVISAFSPGFVLAGKFQLEKQLGRGGMGEAWKAFDTLAERPVVLKFVPKEIQHVREAMDSVKDSFKKVHALQHQHICPVYDLFQDDHHGLCLVMKYIDGLPLDGYRRQLLEKSRNLSFSDLAQILWGVAQGLDYAHEKKVVHRDIKPQNIMVGKTDGVQIIDFGLAEEIRTSMVRFSDVTMDVAGTRPYMAPEQWQGRYQDAATDQYALAVTAYELFSGRVPFQGGDIGILRECVLHDEPDPIASLPDYINAALLKALSKKREDRFESCKAFVRTLTTKPKKKTVPPAVVPAAPPQDADAVAAPQETVVSMPSINLKSEKQNATIWKPQISTDSVVDLKTNKERRSLVPIYAWLGVAAILSILGLIFVFSGKDADTSKESKNSAATAVAVSKPIENVVKNESSINQNTPQPDPIPEFMTPEQYHQFEKETIQWLWEKCHAHIQVKIGNQLKGFHTREAPPEEFGKLVYLGFWAGDRHPSYAVIGPNASDCVIPGYRHGGKQCSCKLSPVELKRINRLRKNEFLHVGGLQFADGDLDILLPGLNIWNLQMMAIPPLAHWDPIRNLTSLKELNVFANELKPRHIEAVAAAPKLQKVDLSQCRFEPGCLDGLSNNESIQNLRLNRTTSLTPDDCIGLSKMKALTELDLAYTPLQWEHLEILGRSPSLKKILLKNNGLTFQEIEGFRQKCPGIELDLKDQTEFPVTFEEIPTEKKEIALADVVWKSAKTSICAPGPCKAHTNQNQYEKSLFTPAPSTLVYRPGGQWNRFESKIAIIARHTPLWYETFRYLHMSGVGDAPSVVFVVKGDGRELYRSKLISSSSEQWISVDISGVDTLELIVEDGGNGPRFDAAAWFDPKLKRDAGTSQNASSLSDEEKKLLRQKYPEFDWTGAHVVVLPEPSEDTLRNAFEKAGETPENDFIIVRTSKEKHRIVLQNGSFTFKHKANEKGSVSLISLGPEKLILDGNRISRIFHVQDAAQANFAGIVFTNGRLVDDAGAAIRIAKNATSKLLLCDIIDNVCVAEKKHPWFENCGAAVAVMQNSSLVLRDVLIEHNRIVNPDGSNRPETQKYFDRSDNAGGVALHNDCSLVATNVVFRKNNGSALCAMKLKELDLRNIAIIDNKALGWSGAVIIGGGDEKQTYKIVNLFATGNSGGWLGGALHIRGKGRYILDHLTLVGNTVGVHGGGICFGSGGHKICAAEVTLSNSIFAGNSGRDFSDFTVNIDPAANDEKIDKLNIINCMTSEKNSRERKRFSDGRNNRFMELAEIKLGELRDFGNGIPVMPLLEGSPAIDAGTETENTPKADITGRPRNVGKTPDIGAFEWRLDLPKR